MLYAYFVDGELVRIKEIIRILAFREMAIADYYFQSGELIIVLEKGNLDYCMTTADFKARYFYKDSKIIKRSEAGTRQSLLLPNEEFFDSQSKEGQLLYSAEKYYQLNNYQIIHFVIHS